jgi:hypothetical protein
MNDDWRLQIDFVDEGLADHLHDRLDAQELEHDLSSAFHDRVIVSRNGTTIFLYAGDSRWSTNQAAIRAKIASTSSAGRRSRSGR